jgi:hypothetical protein
MIREKDEDSKVNFSLELVSYNFHDTFH